LRCPEHLAQAEDEEGAGEEEDGGGGKGGLNIEGAPEGADEEAGAKVAEGIDGGEGAEGHAVLFFWDELGGEGIFESFFRADVKSCQDKNYHEQPERICPSAK